MNCPLESRHPEILVDYAAGALDPEATHALEEHLADCVRCRSMAAEQKAVWLALDAWEAPAASPNFDRRLYSRIAAGVHFSWWERVAGLILQHPRLEAPRVEQHEIVRANQLEKTLDDLELLRQFATSDNAESVQRDAM